MSYHSCVFFFFFLFFDNTLGWRLSVLVMRISSVASVGDHMVRAILWRFKFSFVVLYSLRRFGKPTQMSVYLLSMSGSLFPQKSSFRLGLLNVISCFCECRRGGVTETEGRNRPWRCAPPPAFEIQEPPRWVDPGHACLTHR